MVKNPRLAPTAQFGIACRALDIELLNIVHDQAVELEFRSADVPIQKTVFPEYLGRLLKRFDCHVPVFFLQMQITYCIMNVSVPVIAYKF